MKKIFLGFIVLFLTAPYIYSQSKIGFVQSDRIRAEFEEFKDAESQLQMEFRKVQFEYQTMLMSLDSMKKSFETQRLMSSPEWRREKEQEIFVDISATFPAKKVVNSDSIEDGIDYVDLIHICRDIAKNGKYRLIETLAHQIILQLPKSFPSISSLVIKVKKLQ